MQIKKNHVYVLAAIALVLLAGVIAYPYLIKEKAGEEKQPEKDEVVWLVDTEGYLYYPLDRGDIPFNRQNYSQTEKLSISRIAYPSRKGSVYGLLVLPNYADDYLPGVVLLPGAGVSKESELGLAMKISELGAAVLVLDQRGVGETDGILPSLEEDYSSFVKAEEPYQHLMVYDALRGYDLLHSAPFVDPNRVIIAGESLGGRIAIIAAAIDRNINGVLSISSAGFDFKDKGDKNMDAFIKSLDSDHYISQITPRKLVMIHSRNDTTIPVVSALNSFSKAQEPKKLALVNDTSCNHGYCDAMYDGLVAALDYLVGINSKT